ncbi:hypothetical protein FGADI_11231 [Fusarium gaditjirri]|uniref:Uncharacterized protein n=1 Tax=Fusarium gaditjirri TaxID=282569 RepID=A0A8H4SVN9_9HYPO|nr:hypothetical protein FGADI_11231 [Fusarium gaditjirri]
MAATPRTRLIGPGSVAEELPLVGPLFSVPTHPGPPIPTKTPFTGKRPARKSNRLPLKEESTTKESKKSMPGYGAAYGSAHTFPSATSFESPTLLGTAGVSQITGNPLRLSPIAGNTENQICQTEEAANECFGVLVFLIVILVGAALSGCVLLMKLAVGASKRLGRRFGWKWLKKADIADLEGAISYWKDHPDGFEQYHLNLLRDILASHEGSLHLTAGDKEKEAAEMGSLYSTDGALLPGPQTAHLAPKPDPYWPGMPGSRYPAQLGEYP